MGIVGVLAGVGEDAPCRRREHGFSDGAPTQVGDQRHPGGFQHGGAALRLELREHVTGQSDDHGCGVARPPVEQSGNPLALSKRRVRTADGNKIDGSARAVERAPGIPQVCKAQCGAPCTVQRRQVGFGGVPGNVQHGRAGVVPKAAQIARRSSSDSVACSKPVISGTQSGAPSQRPAGQRPQAVVSDGPRRHVELQHPGRTPPRILVDPGARRAAGHGNEQVEVVGILVVQAPSTGLA